MLNTTFYELFVWLLKGKRQTVIISRLNCIEWVRSVWAINFDRVNSKISSDTQLNISAKCNNFFKLCLN